MQGTMAQHEHRIDVLEQKMDRTFYAAVGAMGVGTMNLIALLGVLVKLVKGV